MKALYLTEAEVKVFYELLRRAEDEMGSHGCNDFILSEDANLSASEVVDFCSELAKAFPYDEIRCSDDQMDWLCLALLKKKIKNLCPS